MDKSPVGQDHYLYIKEETQMDSGLLQVFLQRNQRSITKLPLRPRQHNKPELHALRKSQRLLKQQSVIYIYIYSHSCLARQGQVELLFLLNMSTVYLKRALGEAFLCLSCQIINRFEGLTCLCLCAANGQELQKDHRCGFFNLVTQTHTAFTCLHHVPEHNDGNWKDVGKWCEIGGCQTSSTPAGDFGGPCLRFTPSNHPTAAEFQRAKIFAVAVRGIGGGPTPWCWSFWQKFWHQFLMICYICSWKVNSGTNCAML